MTPRCRIPGGRSAPEEVSRWLSKGLRLQLENKAFADRIETLHRALSDATRDNAEMPRVAP